MTEPSTGMADDPEKDRFEFGRNWSSFLPTVEESGVTSATGSLSNLLGVQSLRGLRFLDVGCGSGLSSLAARRLGAEVLSFDYDPRSVSAALHLKERFARGDNSWRIQQGSALDADLLKRLGNWDVVYSWGVLHHTGSMWTAIDLISGCVAPHGQLILAIYNDQGAQSRFWHVVKRGYVRMPLLRPFLIAISAPVLWGPSLLGALSNGRARHWWSGYQTERGMSRWHDLIDWVGGYPFEVASADAIVRYCEARGFQLERLISTHRLGCNQFAFRRAAERSNPRLNGNLASASQRTT